MSETYTTGTWVPNAGEEDAFVEAWTRFASCASSMSGAGALQLTAKHKVATPVNWKQGEDVIISGSVSNDEAEEKFPGYKTVKPYLRTTKQPA